MKFSQIEWSKEDWIDFHRTLEEFKQRLVKRHTQPDPCADDSLCRECKGDGICIKRNPLYTKGT